ncbi:FkbM family methyltransferase [Pseudorhodoplanes sp.]|jgi:FkbM family methyltransferase|uniref:FkbM family methyltransferase n=1 Tax=Pseudorhodoplanes sp. TaxID=1934341 RepID=UPI002C664036|nr:FkbM family methyltransferase [Pseudorhodoplanes sp.]HWV41622.1 FkbM family methyltransferase [Pseudorhodoplanes sp.]
MSTYDVEMARLNSPKQKLLSSFPGVAVYARYLKALLRGEAELRLLPWLCNRGLVTVDAGAHHGIFTLGASLFSRQVVAVEPQAHLTGALRRSIPSNATLVEGALSDKPGEAMLMIPLHEWDSRAHLASKPEDSGEWRMQRVPLYRMDAVVRERVGFVKIDVEGHEREVLEGATRIIENDRPAFLIEIEERHRAGSVADITRFMEDRGYHCYFVRDDRIRPFAEFDLARDQAPSLIGVGDRANYKDYINNFIFVTPGFRLPDMVPSPREALSVSIRRMLGRGERDHAPRDQR